MQRWNPSAGVNCCLKCGSHVTPEFRRGCGDERNRVHRCYNCDTKIRLDQHPPFRLNRSLSLLRSDAFSLA
ncbi:DUF7563 family protein [Halovivax gelatinilyticus]|uniref:DUF7563 family protein n=1 Tax=Halovivax gelatinilyticus TaxID=2961597 RepID=UPI003CCD12F1